MLLCSVPRRAIGDMAIVRTGMPFRARPEHELRRAEVAVAHVARWESGQEENFLPGLPKFDQRQLEFLLATTNDDHESSRPRARHTR